MSDVGTLVATPDPEEPGGDPELTALLEKLGPALLATAQAAVDKAVAAVPTPTFRPGEVQGVDASTRTASVLLDGDTTAISAQVLTDLPGLYDRVMVTFVPPSAVFVTGLITTSGIPSGTLAPYAGSITAHAGAAATAASPGQPPRGWLWCAGQAVSRTDYASLYTAIGTSWGSGNGTTTFNVPDFRGRDFRGLDNMGGSDAGRISASNTLGGTGGSNTITQAMLPNVSLSVSSGSLSGASVTGSVSGSISGSTDNPGNHSHLSPNGASFVVGSGGAVVPATGIYNIDNTVGNTTQGAGAHTHTVSGSFSGSISGGSVSGGSVSGQTASLGGSGAEHLPPYALVHVIIKI